MKSTLKKVAVAAVVVGVVGAAAGGFGAEEAIHAIGGNHHWFLRLPEYGAGVTAGAVLGGILGGGAGGVLSLAGSAIKGLKNAGRDLR